MILKKIWERHIFYEIIKLVLFFTAAIYAVFIAIDFSIHGTKMFAYANTTMKDIILYYINFLFVNLNLFLALTFLLAIIKVLADMNVHNELTALRMGGISAKLISRPFIIVAVIISIISFWNLEYKLPKALNNKDTFKEKNLKKTAYRKKIHPNIIYLQDYSRLVYQKYDRINKELFDVYWVKSNKDLWHAKYLFLDSFPIKAKHVDHLIKENGFFKKIDSFDEHLFSDMKIDINDSASIFVPYDNRSISTLYKQKNAKIASQKELAEISTHLNYKLAMPFVSILIILSIFPFLIKFSRNISIFFISCFSLFGFVIFYTLMDSALILSENAVMPAFICIWSPLIISLVFFGKRYLKI